MAINSQRCVCRMSHPHEGDGRCVANGILYMSTGKYNTIEQRLCDECAAFWTGYGFTLVAIGEK